MRQPLIPEVVYGRVAKISPCGTYRYTLGRRWGTGPTLGWVMLNPSTADARADDPTVRRCIRFSREAGYGGLVIVNLFALRATDPRELLTHPDPVGGNDKHLLNAVWGCPATVLAWGTHAEKFYGRVRSVLHELSQTKTKLLCLGRTRGGHPRHPLYAPATAKLLRWRA
jgi:hypothetical protein